MNAHSVSLGTWGKAFGSLGPCLVKEWVENAIVWGSGSAGRRSLTGVGGKPEGLCSEQPPLSLVPRADPCLSPRL